MLNQKCKQFFFKEKRKHFHELARTAENCLNNKSTNERIFREIFNLKTERRETRETTHHKNHGNQSQKFFGIF